MEHTPKDGHLVSPGADGTPQPVESAEGGELTEEEATAERDRLDAEHRAKRAEDRAHSRQFARQMGAHIVRSWPRSIRPHSRRCPSI